MIGSFHSVSMLTWKYNFWSTKVENGLEKLEHVHIGTDQRRNPQFESQLQRFTFPKKGRHWNLTTINMIETTLQEHSINHVFIDKLPFSHLKHIHCWFFVSDSSQVHDSGLPWEVKVPSTWLLACSQDERTKWTLKDGRLDPTGDLIGGRQPKGISSLSVCFLTCQFPSSV